MRRVVARRLIAVGVVCVLGAAGGFLLSQKRERDAAWVASEVERLAAAAQRDQERRDRPLPPAPPPPRMPEALARARPAAEQANDLDEGSITFLRWAVAFMRWDDVATGKNQTTFAKVMKDPATEQGRALCLKGQIVEIVASTVNERKVFAGTILTEAEEPVRFVAVRDTGDLVAQSSALFCGVALGAITYQSLVGHGVRAMNLVGMFALPANVATARPKASAAPNDGPPR